MRQLTKQILVVIDLYDIVGGCTIEKVAHTLGEHQEAIASRVEELHSEGLVTRSDDDEPSYKITPDGIRAVNESIPETPDDTEVPETP